ncbi:excisionase family DNA-binding protein [Paraburkholderia caledonica]|uniref:excisionase family DNA-binding protein n=1 Tax=Paraburkholderia caledonica TaxID=134536 RepID=UPI001D0C8FDB
MRSPRPSHVTQQQAAEMLGLHRNTIRRFIDSGRLRLNRCGLIPTEQVDGLLRITT